MEDDKMANKNNTIKDNTKTKKITNSLKMLEILKEAKKEGKRLKAREIRQLLNVNRDKAIYHYRNTLENFGYRIKSYGGYDGGYELIIGDMLTDEELKFLESIIPVNKKEILEKIKNMNSIVK